MVTSTKDVDSAAKAERSRPVGTRTSQRQTGGSRGESSGGVDRKLAERCGAEVVRLTEDWSDLFAAIVAAGAESVRVSNGAVACGHSLDRAGYRRADGRFEVTWPDGGLQSQIESWSRAYLDRGVDGAGAGLSVVAEDGTALFDFRLGPSQVRRLSRHRERLEHDLQEPHEPVRPDEGPDVHRSTVDDRALEANWRRSSSLGDIAGLCDGFRLGRAELLDRLPARWAVSVPTLGLDRLVNAIDGTDAGVAAKVCTRGTDVDVTSGLRLRHRGRDELLFEVEQTPIAVEREGVGAVYDVRKPTGRGLARALEVFDTTGRRALCLRLSPGADFHARMIWRSCSPGHFVRQ